jgi:hypothetical protein
MFTIKTKDISGYSTKTFLNEVKWLASALAKNDGRFHVSHIWARSDGSALATSGHVLHLVEHSGLSEGFYKVVKQTKYSITLEMVTDTFDMPDCDSVINDKPKAAVCLEGETEDKALSAYTKLIRTMKANGVDYRLFEAAIKGMDTFDITVKTSGETAIYIESANRLAIVMPFRTEAL